MAVALVWPTSTELVFPVAEAEPVAMSTLPSLETELET